MNGHKSNRLFREIVRRTNRGIGNESEVALAVSIKSLRHVVGMLRIRRFERRIADDVDANPIQRATESLLANELITTCNRPEKLAKVLS